MRTVGATFKSDATFLGLAVLGFVALFWTEMRDLVLYWERNPDFSHGYAIPLISGAILYANRQRLAALPNRGHRVGLAFLLVALGLLFIGLLTDTNSFRRLALISGLVGAAGFALGTPFLKACPFPFIFLLFSIPPPLYHLTRFQLVLQRLVTDLSARVLFNLGDPALAQGNVLIVGEAQFGVTEACSGIRSLMAILTTAALLAYLTRSGAVKGTILVLLGIPITIGINVFRLLVIAWAWVHWDVQALASGWPHEALGLACFLLSLGLLFLTQRLLDWVAPNPEASS